ncbi:MAG: glycosyltransferase [Clostridia bacterium]|nr:glycosyltransferase [Clostridia bacterium]
MKISVALAAYKGEKFIGEQIKSILAQLPPDGEIIVSDDLPGGETKQAVSDASGGDSRVKYIEGPGKGVCANFENAIRACSGDVIFLSDQDDVWLPQKINSVMKEFENGADVVLHDAYVTDAQLEIKEESFFAVHSSKSGFAANLVKNSFVGCCMALTKEVADMCLPFPAGLPMHDWWIALLALKRHKKVVLLPERLIYWRRHENTVTGKKNSLAQQLKWRAKMIILLIERK